MGSWNGTCGLTEIRGRIPYGKNKIPGKGLYGLGKQLGLLKEDAGLLDELKFWKEHTMKSVDKWGGHNK